MKKSNVKVSSLVEYQLPEFVRTEYPLLSEFLKEYYRSTEYSFGHNDIISNINNYIKLDTLSNIQDEFHLFNISYKITEIRKDPSTILNGENVVRITTLTPHGFLDGDVVRVIPQIPPAVILPEDQIQDFSGPFLSAKFEVTVVDEFSVYLRDSTVGISPRFFASPEGGLGTITKFFIEDDDDEILIYAKDGNRKSLPDRYGLVKIDEEVILYKDIDPNPVSILVDNVEYNAIKLIDCARGFSGTTSLGESGDDQLIFESTEASTHEIDSKVQNLSAIFLKKFLEKIKSQFLPGFEKKNLNPKMNESLFIKQSKDFYSSKGTDTSFKILFAALYGEDVEVIKPRDFLIEPSNASYKVVKNLVVEALEGNPEDLLNRTLFQDDVGFIGNARGTVSFVERIERNQKEYFIVSIDDGYERDINFRGTLFSQFSIHPKTLVSNAVFVGDTTIDVDSTVGFPNSGTLNVYVTDPVTNFEFVYEIEYKTKTLNQFLECQTKDAVIANIRNEITSTSVVYSDTFAYGFAGSESDELIRVRISGVLSEFKENEQTFLYEKGNKIRVRSLGEESTRKKDNNWIFNIPITYEIEEAFLEDEANNLYRLTFVDEHNFRLLDTFVIEENTSITADVISVPSKNSIVVRLSESVGTPIPPDSKVLELQELSISRKIAKVSLTNYPDLNIYNSNVQNVYLDNDKSLYVASPSLPSYSDLSSGGSSPLDISDGSNTGRFIFGKRSPDGQISSLENKLFTDGNIDYAYFTIFSVDANGNPDQAIEHGFYTGDEVVFRSLNSDGFSIPDGIYYVKEFKSVGDIYGLKLSSSRSNILNERYVSPTLDPITLTPDITETDCSIQYFDLSVTDPLSSDYLKPQQVGPQNLFRKISDPILDTVKYETKFGTTGIFVNGVEILNYKSKNSIFYGSIDSIDIISPGSGYDIINPDQFQILDSGGAVLKYDATSASPVIFDDLPVKFGTTGLGSTVTYDGIGGEEIKISGKNLLLGTKKLFINQTSGTSVRINGLLVTVGGNGGTQLSLGGDGGFSAKISDEFLTLGSIGNDAEVFPSISGDLKRIDLLYEGFNYIGIPKVTINGGNGSGALAEPIMESFEYRAPFVPKENIMDIDADTIGFSTYHNFENYEEVVYISGITTTIFGLEDKSSYFVSVEDPLNVKLYKSKENAVVGISTIDIKAYSTGVHFLKSKKNKSKIGSINIINPGKNYSTRKIVTTPQNVNIVTNTITCKNHGYNSGELIVHFSDGTLIGGLSENTSYYVTKIDDNNFKLSEIYNDQDIFEAPQDFNFTTGQFVNLTSSGSGNLFFNYEPISVSVNGFIGVSTSGGQDLNAKVRPIFRGELVDLFVSNAGSDYGANDILNFSKQPQLEVVKGKNAQLVPLISEENGQIEEVLVINQGKDYFSTPDLVIRGDGIGAVLIPRIEDNKLVSIKILYKGSGYTKENTRIDVIARGEGAKANFNINRWEVNLLSRFRLTDRETTDGGFVYSGLNQNYGLQYTHIYLPDKLRQIAYNDFDVNGATFPDADSDTGERRHSPIVGWSYDGYPIYGPYGYANGQSGVVRTMKSSYSLKEVSERENGPPFALYPAGFFVQDYEYRADGEGDLDESNGRYCKTPEYPNGTYAYFCTVDDTVPITEPNGYPSVFPFIIGNIYKGKPIDFNFDPKSNQNDIDLNDTGWFRNTSPYNFTNKPNSNYDYLLTPNKIKDPISQVKYASYGELETVDVITKGDFYKVGDKIKFENDDVLGQGGTAEVTEIEGKVVRSVSVARSTFTNVEFSKYDNSSELIGFTQDPHGYSTGDIVSITTPIERIVFKEINFYINNLFTTKEIPVSSVSGIVTYFEVSGDLSNPNIRENDIYEVRPVGVNTTFFEQVRILNVDKRSNLVRVQREVDDNDSTVLTYGLGSRLVELPRKFSANLGIQTYYNYNTNYEYYFDAEESVGLGSDTSAGITSVVNLKYPRLGISTLTIPQRSIYLPNHGFETNQILEYSNKISPNITYIRDVDDAETTLPDRVFSVKLSNDLIGLSTSLVGVGTTGNFFSLEDGEDPLIYFQQADGNLHSFTTLNPGLLKATVSQNIVTVSTGSSHGLKTGDEIDISVSAETTQTIVIEYNDEARVLVTNPINFTSSQIDLDENIFNITNHGYRTNEKLIYKSDTPSSGLIDNQIYFVVAIGRDSFALVDSLFESNKEFPKFISIGTAQDGTFYSINPEIQVIKGQTIVFDTSSETLSFVQGASPVLISAFSFDIYEDANFNHIYISTGKDQAFDVVKSGDIGNPGSSVTLTVSTNLPETLYYKLTPLDIVGIPFEKENIFIDSEQKNNNKITTVKSGYDGTYKIFDEIERDPTVPPFEYSEFKYQIPRNAESDSYDLDNSTITYKTKSQNADGPISNAVIKNRGRYFFRLPSKTEIISESGNGAIISAFSENIGQIKTVNVGDIGFDYPSDLTVRPIAKLPTIFKVEPLYSIESILIVSNGLNYLLPPDIAVIDAKTNNLITDLLLSYELGDNFVTIVRNTKNLSNIAPTLIPVNNSNGIPLLLNQADIITLNLNDNSTNDEVVAASDNSLLDDDAPESAYNLPDSLPFVNIPTITLFLATEYSSIYDFPFELGDLVFIEDVITIAETDGFEGVKGFNSITNNYAFYKVVRRDPNIGGSSASITLDFKGYVDETVNDPEDSDFYKVDEIVSQSARVVPVKYFPSYRVSLRKNNFSIDEELITGDGSSIGIVEQWDAANDYLKISETKVFSEGSTVVGQTSKTKAILLEKIEFDAGYTVDSTSVVNQGWDYDTGKLNFDLQRVHDNDYYQYFSYALKSKVPLQTWNDDVGSLNHTAGFKRFSELEVETSPEDFSGISTSQDTGISFGLSDIISEVSVNCVYDYDLARETTFGSPSRSNEIILGSRIVQDYIESISNRVLSIDDISKNFNALPRETTFSVVGRSDALNIRAKKTFFYAQDRRFTDDRQMIIVTTVHNDTDVVVGQYGRLETTYDLAYFDSNIIGEQQNILFFPSKFDINNFLVDFVSFEIETGEDAEIENLDFGNVARVYNQEGTLDAGALAGIGETVVGIASTYRSSKLLVLVGSATTTYYEFNELTVQHDDLGNVNLTEYGELTTGFSDGFTGIIPNEGITGIASFSAKMSEDETTLDIVMTPYEDLTDDYFIKTVTTSIANTSFTETDGIGFETGEVSSFTLSGISTEIPEPVNLTEYSSQYKCSYIMLSMVGLQTGTPVPYAVGERDHGVSDFYAFGDGTATYSAIYPNTEIIEVSPEGYRTTLVTTGSDPQRGSIGITSGNRYYGTYGIGLFTEGEQHQIAPVSYAGTSFGHYIKDKGVSPGITTFFIYAPEETTDVQLFDGDLNGIAGIASTTITVDQYSSGIHTSASVDEWIYFYSEKPVIMTVLGAGSNDQTILAPAATGIGTTSYKYYPNAAQPLTEENFRTIYGQFPTGITTSGIYETNPVICLRNDSATQDIIQGILLDYISDTYTWGNTLSDYVIAAPYGNTTVNVSYWDGAAWVLGESHDLTGGTFITPVVAQRDGTNGFGVWATTTDGTASNFASGANIWKFEGTEPFVLVLNDTFDDEETLLGFSSERSQRPLNIEYRTSEIQLINNSVDSFYSEFGIVSNEPSGEIGTVGLGTFGSLLQGSNTFLRYTPSPLIEYSINGFQVNVGRF